MKKGLGPAKHIEGYLNSKELCKELDCHQVTLVNFTTSGRIPKPDLIMRGRAYYWSIELLPTIKANLGIGG